MPGVRLSGGATRLVVEYGGEPILGRVLFALVGGVVGGGLLYVGSPKAVVAGWCILSIVLLLVIVRCWTTFDATTRTITWSIGLAVVPIVRRVWRFDDVVEVRFDARDVPGGEDSFAREQRLLRLVQHDGRRMTVRQFDAMELGQGVLERQLRAFIGINSDSAER